MKHEKWFRCLLTLVATLQQFDLHWFKKIANISIALSRKDVLEWEHLEITSRTKQTMEKSAKMQSHSCTENGFSRIHSLLARRSLRDTKVSSFVNVFSEKSTSWAYWGLGMIPHIAIWDNCNLRSTTISQLKDSNTGVYTPWPTCWIIFGQASRSFQTMNLDLNLNHFSRLCRTLVSMPKSSETSSLFLLTVTSHKVGNLKRYLSLFNCIISKGTYQHNGHIQNCAIQIQFLV